LNDLAETVLTWKTEYPSALGW